MARFDQVLLTCEHGGNRVPPRYRSSFHEHQASLCSHWSYDEGALALARALVRGLGAPLFASTTTRLLVDMNRPETDRTVFSTLTRTWPAPDRERLLKTLHRPHWRRVFAYVGGVCGEQRTLLHLACHSFTPVRDGRVRTTDLGLLYDPRRRDEARLCDEWAWRLGRCLPGLRVHRNRPYRGWSPGLTTSLRQSWSSRLYLGVEIELNQALPGSARRRIHRALVATLHDVNAAERRSTR